MDGRCQKPDTRSTLRPAMHEEATFDYDRSLARLGGDPGLFAEIVVLFLEDAPQLLDRVREGLEQQNQAELERAAHSLKGLSVNFDAKRLSSAAASVEQHARENDLERAAACYPNLEQEFRRLKDDLVAFRDSAS